MDAKVSLEFPSREQLLHSLYEAAELEHNLMCTYLYAAYSLKDGMSEGLTEAEAKAVSQWRQSVLDVAVEEMGHLTAVWNITSAIGGTPRFGRTNFPLEPGLLPAGMVVKLTPFNEATLQHFIYLERPEGPAEPDGPGFEPARQFLRGVTHKRLTPMATDYATVGEFYAALGDRLKLFVADVGEDIAFCGDPALQMAPDDRRLKHVKPVRCLKTALAAFDAIVLEGEGAPEDAEGSHFQRFVKIREDMVAINATNERFVPAHRAATNPVLRRPPTPEGRVWIEDEEASATVDLANACYGLMLRLLGTAYTLPAPSPEKALCITLSTGLMRAMSLAGERAARLPAGPSNPDCNAGVSFTALRDAAPLPAGASARRFFIERIGQLAAGAQVLAQTGDARMTSAARHLASLQRTAEIGFAQASSVSTTQPAEASTSSPPVLPAPPSSLENGIERVEGEKLTLDFEAKRCIHARFCVTGAPTVFLANVKGAWIYPDMMDVERLVDIAHACPSGAIRYQRKDGRPNEPVPPVNLAAIREAGPYAFRGELYLDGEPLGARVTLCRCGASKNKPFCDGSHHDVQFNSTGEPATVSTEMLPERNGALLIAPQIDGPLVVSGNLEIISGTGRVVSRGTSAQLCRCGGSSTKPFCDGTHRLIDFKSD